MAAPAGARLVDEGAGSVDKTLTVPDGLYHEIFNEPEKGTVLGDVVDWIAEHIWGRRSQHAARPAARSR